MGELAFHCPLPLAATQLTFYRVPQTPTVALLVLQSDGTTDILYGKCPLKMLTTFCPELKVVKDPSYGKSITLSGAPSQAFQTICLWMGSCVEAKKKGPFPIPEENTYVRLASLKKAATSLHLDALVEQFEEKMHILELHQLHSNAIKGVYAISPPDHALRQRAAKSIGKLLWEKRIRNGHHIMQLRKQLHEFDADVNEVMDGYYEASAAHKAGRQRQREVAWTTVR